MRPLEKGLLGGLAPAVQAGDDHVGLQHHAFQQHPLPMSCSWHGAA